MINKVRGLSKQTMENKIINSLVSDGKKDSYLDYVPDFVEYIFSENTVEDNNKILNDLNSLKNCMDDFIVAYNKCNNKTLQDVIDIITHTKNFSMEDYASLSALSMDQYFSKTKNEAANVQNVLANLNKK